MTHPTPPHITALATVPRERHGVLVDLIAAHLIDHDALTAANVVHLADVAGTGVGR